MSLCHWETACLRKNFGERYRLIADTQTGAAHELEKRNMADIGPWRMHGKIILNGSPHTHSTQNTNRAGNLLYAKTPNGRLQTREQPSGRRWMPLASTVSEDATFVQVSVIARLGPTSDKRTRQDAMDVRCWHKADIPTRW